MQTRVVSGKRAMIGPSEGVVNAFAKAFAQKGKGKGLTKDELLAWFRRYSNNVVDPDFYGINLTKEKLFHHCLERLYVEDQYRALIDLCEEPPQSVNTLPGVDERKALLTEIFSAGSPSPATMRLLEIGPWEIQRLWLELIGRIERSPAAAVTSARTMLEQTCKSICTRLEVDTKPTAGDLAKLVKVTRDALGLQDGAERVLSGMSTMVFGLAQRSNTAGDRHAPAMGSAPTTATEARLFANVAASISIFLLDHLHLVELTNTAGAESSASSDN